jgi:hypothetical protein
MPRMLNTIERQHARADHSGRRKPRIVDCEGGGIAHHPHRQVVAGDQPSAQHPKPRHRLGRPQLCQQWVRVFVELAQRRAAPRPIGNILVVISSS